MTRSVCQLLAVIGTGIIACSCQTADPTPPPREEVELNYTMLGIWPQRFQAYEISDALKEAGIRSQLSGYQPCILNVEATKLRKARELVDGQAAWRDSAVLLKDAVLFPDADS